MPTYVYKFIDTGETIEVQQSFTDETLTKFAHPSTGEPMPVKKVFLPVGVTFKGDGFYKNDSRASSKKQKSGSTGNGESGSTSSDSSSSDSSSSSSDSKSGTSSESSSSSTASSSSSTSSPSSSSSSSSD